MDKTFFELSDEAKERVGYELWKIEQEKGVSVLFAVESGSRAWGFASQDSDYDVRFVYKRPVYDYLRLDKRKDTIEWHPSEELDMVGWDVSKYLSLLKNSNPSSLEWLQCPRYVVNYPFRLASIERLAEDCLSARSLAFHYLGMAKKNANEFLRIADGKVRDELPKTKKYVFVVRALLSARYVCDWCEMPYIELDNLIEDYRERLEKDGVTESITRLIERKRAGLETDVHERIHELDQWVMDNVEDLETRAKTLSGTSAPDWDKVNELFLSIVTS